jgi:hypothetical protein
MEMHLVHFKLAYGTLAEAKTHPDGLAVAAFLFKADGNNHEYKPLYVILQKRFIMEPLKTVSAPIIVQAVKILAL